MLQRSCTSIKGSSVRESSAPAKSPLHIPILLGNSAEIDMVVKTVLITGCSAGGIGSALALAFQKKDFQVFATARNISKMEHLTQAGIFMVSLDVTSAESIAAAVKVVEAKTGARLDILVNSCGIGT